MSTGLPCDQVAGRHWPSSCTLPALSSASLPPPSESASAASTPAPPPLVRTARRSPHQRCAWAKVSTASNCASSVSTRNMPARRTAASNTVSDPAMAPVCDAAALAPSGARPALTRMTGLLRAAARVADMNLRAALTDSTYSRWRAYPDHCPDSARRRAWPAGSSQPRGKKRFVVTNTLRFAPARAGVVRSRGSRVAGATLMRHQNRQIHGAQYRARGAAQYPFARTAVAVAAHDKQVGLKVKRLRQKQFAE